MYERTSKLSWSLLHIIKLRWCLLLNHWNDLAQRWLTDIPRSKIGLLPLRFISNLSIWRPLVWRALAQTLKTSLCLLLDIYYYGAIYKYGCCWGYLLPSEAWRMIDYRAMWITVLVMYPWDCMICGGGSVKYSRPPEKEGSLTMHLR